MFKFILYVFLIISWISKVFQSRIFPPVASNQCWEFLPLDLLMQDAQHVATCLLQTFCASFTTAHDQLTKATKTRGWKIPSWYYYHVWRNQHYTGTWDTLTPVNKRNTESSKHIMWTAAVNVASLEPIPQLRSSHLWISAPRDAEKP